MTDAAADGREQIIASYADALAAFRSLGPVVTDWRSPTPCGRWTLHDLAGHLLAVARYWQRLLDAATDGHPLVDLPRGDDLAAMNAADLAALPEARSSERFDRFLERATAYGARVQDADWSVVLGTWSGLGPLSIGEHTGVAIGEWHVHAWDMARSLGRDHRPRHAAAVASGNRVLGGAAVPGDEWRGVLLCYGRDPEWRAADPPDRGTDHG